MQILALLLHTETAASVDVRLPVVLPVVIAPPVPDPAALPPHPPASDLRVEVVRVRHHALAQLRPLRQQPAVPRSQIVMVRRPIGVPRRLRVVGHERAVEVGDVGVQLANHLARRRERVVKRHHRGATQRLSPDADLADALPDGVDPPGFTAEKWGRAPTACRVADHLRALIGCHPGNPRRWICTPDPDGNPDALFENNGILSLTGSTLR